MDCTHLSPGGEEALLSYALDGKKLSPEEKNHLESCSLCQQKVHHYQRTADILVHHLYRYQCPDADDLSLYSADLFSGVKKRYVELHIAKCPLCAEEVELSRAFFDEIEADVLPHRPLIL